MRLCTSIIILLLSSAGVLGAEAAEPGTPNSLPGPSVGATIFRMIGSLAVVFGVFIAAAWIFRNGFRFQAGKTRPRQLRVVESRSIAPRQSLYVVAFEQQRFLIGSTPQGISLLTHLPEGAPEEQPEAVVAVSFSEAMMQALNRK